MSVTLSDPSSSIYFKGEEDAAGATARRFALRRCLTGESVKVTVDLGEATFIDASAVSDILGLAEHLSRQGRQLEIRRCSRDINKLLHFAGLGMIDSVRFADHASPQRVLKRRLV